MKPYLHVLFVVFHCRRVDYIARRCTLDGRPISGASQFGVELRLEDIQQQPRAEHDRMAAIRIGTRDTSRCRSAHCAPPSVAAVGEWIASEIHSSRSGESESDRYGVEWSTAARWRRGARSTVFVCGRKMANKSPNVARSFGAIAMRCHGCDIAHRNCIFIEFARHRFATYSRLQGTYNVIDKAINLHAINTKMEFHSM